MNNDEENKAIEEDERCSIDAPKEFEDFSYIEYIIKSLRLFNIYRVRNKNKEDWDLNYLCKCYEHIINVHLFCIDKELRTKLQKFTSNDVGPCSSMRQCAVLGDHASRRREKISSRDTKQNLRKRVEARTEISISQLNSILMHSYVVHTDSELCRLRNTDVDAHYDLPQKKKDWMIDNFKMKVPKLTQKTDADEVRNESENDGQVDDIEASIVDDVVENIQQATKLKEAEVEIRGVLNDENIIKIDEVQQTMNEDEDDNYQEEDAESEEVNDTKSSGKEDNDND